MKICVKIEIENNKNKLENSKESNKENENKNNNDDNNNNNKNATYISMPSKFSKISSQNTLEQKLNEKLQFEKKKFSRYRSKIYKQKNCVC